MSKCYQRKAMSSMNDDEMDDEFDPEYFFIELKDIATSDMVISMKFFDAYKRLERGWNMDKNDEDYLNWEYDFMSWIADRAEQNDWDVDSAIEEMKRSLDNIVKTGRNYDEA